MKNKAFIIFIFSCLLAVSCSDKSKSSINKKKSSTENSNVKVLNFTTISEINNFKNEVEIIKKAYAKIGYKIQVHPLPSKRALQEAKNNSKYDGEVGRVKEAAQILNEHIRIKVPFLELKLYPYFLDDSIKVNSWNDLYKYKFGYLRGAVIIEKIIKSGSGEACNTYKQCFNMLKEGRLEVVITDISFERSPWLKSLLPKLKKSSSPLNTFNVYHFIHKKHKALVPQLTQALSEITGNPIETD